mgnify:CR=1 FL=1
MKRETITISENGVITIPSETTAPILMRDFEIAQLFGVYSQTVKAAIKAVLQSGVVAPDCTHGGVVVGKSILPEYYGLDIITAIAFRIHSPQTQVFRKLVLSKLSVVSKRTSVPLFIQVGSSKRNNEFKN